MKLLIIFAFLVIVTAEEQKECETVSVRGKTHRKHVLASGHDRPYQLSMYKHEHKIFFSYNVGKNEEDSFEIGYIKTGEDNVKTIKEVTNGFASAVDQENHLVYLGGSKGIYRYHPKEDNDTVEHIIKKHNIWYMFFHKQLYFIDFPSQKLYTYKTDENNTSPEHQSHITDKIYQFAIDKDGDQFITTDKGVYRIKQGSNERMLYSNVTLFRGVALDNKGHVYFCGGHSIYETDKDTHSLKEVASVRNVFGITFDSQDNIIYSDPKKIVKLLPGDCK